MKSFFYTKSQVLNQYLYKIEELRASLSLVPITPSFKNQIRWQALNNRINLFFELEEETITKYNFNQVKNTMNYVYQNWYASPEAITASTIIDLYDRTFKGKLTIPENEINDALRYIQISSEHPIVQAALAKIIFVSLEAFSKEDVPFSNIVMTLFLYKHGYDFRRMITFEDFFNQDKVNYQELIKTSIKKQNLTQWLEYFTSGLIEHLEKTLEEIKIKRVDKKSHIDLNDRQKQILFLFEEPNTKVTNKMVMKKYKVSPVTAARDLSKLSSLNLILMVGKGRSTYYIKV